MPVFAVQRASRPWLIWAGGAWVVACVAVGVLVAKPWLGTAGLVGFMASFVLALRTRAATLEVTGGTISPSWRAEIRDPTIAIGWRLQAGLDTPIGIVIHARGDGGGLSIGVAGHTGEGFEMTAAPARTVDCELPLAELASLQGAFVVAPAARGATFALPLQRNRTGAGSALGNMWPWLATIAASAAVGPLLIGARPAVQAGVIGPIVVGGLAWTMIRASRVRPIDHALVLGADGLTLAAGGREVRAPWSTVAVVRRQYQIPARGSYLIPAIELRLADQPPLIIATWDTAPAWPDQPERLRRAPPWLLGRPHWELLVAALRDHGCL